MRGARAPLRLHSPEPRSQLGQWLGVGAPVAGSGAIAGRRWRGWGRCRRGRSPTRASCGAGAGAGDVSLLQGQCGRFVQRRNPVVFALLCGVVEFRLIFNFFFNFFFYFFYFFL